MLKQEIKEKVMRDLNITERRARMYTTMFADKFVGDVRAITHLSATYTDNGKIRMSYVIDNKKFHLVLDAHNPYAEEVRKRLSVQTNGQQIVDLLTKLYPNVTPKEWEDDWVNTFEFEAQGRVLHIRVDELPSLDILIDSLKSCGIKLSAVGIEMRFGHLTLTITNFNPKTKTDIQFIND